MIFRRNTDLPQTKTPMTTNSRDAAPTMTVPTTPRTNAYTQAMPTAAQTATAPATPPVSPIAMAQARRTPPNTNINNLASNFSRPEQLRKLTVGRDISLNGEITTCDHLIVEGTVTATIKGGQILEITDIGAFSGTVDIETADIAGRFEGNLTVRGKLVLRPTAYVTGTVQYGALQIDSGATLNGNLMSLGNEQAAKTPFTTHETFAATDSKPQDQNAHGISMLNDQPGFLKASA